MTDRKLNGRRAGVVEWNSNKSHCVVKSTLAAEAASVSCAYDRLCFVRVALAEMIYGWGSNWSNLLDKIPGRCVTDCKSFVDMYCKEGSMPTERRIALDVADLRERLEAGYELARTDTRLMLADPLTKHMPDQGFLENVLKQCNYTHECKEDKKIK